MADAWKKPLEPSKPAAIRARLDHPVIDTDLNTIEFAPRREDWRSFSMR